MVAAKSLVAAALAWLVYAAVAYADAPSVKFTKADQTIAAADLLHRSDLGPGWTGGRIATTPLTPPDCPGFNPKESDLTVSGHADARFTFAPAGVELDQDVQVLASAAAVETDFERSISPKLAGCLGYQLDKLPNVTDAVVRKMLFPPTGAVSAAYRAIFTVRTGKAQGKLLSDYVFFGEGRVEYEFTIIAPLDAGSQLPRFEAGLAQILLRRMGATTA